MSENWKPKFIQLPIDKMAGAPWNLLDHRGFRIAWCGTDGNHEKDGELIANDLLNLIAIGEAVGELHERATTKQADLQAKLDRVTELVEKWRDGELDCCWDGLQMAADDLEQALKGEEAQHDALKKEQIESNEKH